MAGSTTATFLRLLVTYSLLVSLVQSKKEIPRMVSSECALRHIQIWLRMKNCIPLRILTRACGGTCPSYTTMSVNDPTKLEANCDCCQYVGRKRKYFAVRCFTTMRKRKSIKIASFVLPKGCRCRPCSAISDQIVSSESRIFQTSPILGDLINSNTFKRSYYNNFTYFIDG